MNEPVSLSAVNERTLEQQKQIDALIANNNALLARQTAINALLHVVLWGWGKSRKEVGDEILKSGAANLSEINKLPVDMQKEIVDIWNSGYAKLMGPSQSAFQVGQKPG